MVQHVRTSSEYSLRDMDDSVFSLHGKYLAANMGKMHSQNIVNLDVGIHACK